MENTAKNKRKTQPIHITLALVMLLFGVLLTAQFRTHIAVSNALENQTIDDLGAIILSLSEKQQEVSKNLALLQKELRSLEEKTSAGMSLEATLTNQVKQLQMITGATPVEGQGISVTITGDSPLMYLDLIDLVNELLVSGAEAIAINDKRIRFNTIIGEGYNTKGEIVINIDGSELLSPVVIKAIGNPDTLEKGLTYTGGIINMFNVLYQLFPTIRSERLISIPGASPAAYRYIKYNP